MDHREQLAQLLREVEREGLLSFEEDAEWLLARGVQLSEERPSLPPDVREALNTLGQFIGTTLEGSAQRREAARGALYVIHDWAVRSVDSLRPPEEDAK